MFARPSVPVLLPENHTAFFHRSEHRITAAFDTTGFLSRALNYTLLGGTAPHVAGLFAGLCLGLGLDAMARQLDSHQFSESDPEKRYDHLKVGALLGSSTVMKNAWLQSWKSRHPYHWVSQMIMVLDGLLSNQFTRQVSSSLGYIHRRSFIKTRFGPKFLPLQCLRLFRQQIQVLVARLSDPTILRKRLGLKSMRNSTFNFLDNGYQWFKHVPWVVPVWKKLYMPILLASSTLRGTPIAARMHAGVLLRGQHKSFGWRAIRMLPGLGLDILLTSSVFYGIHTLLHSGHHEPEPLPARNLTIA